MLKILLTHEIDPVKLPPPRCQLVSSKCYILFVSGKIMPHFPSPVRKRKITQPAPLKHQPFLDRWLQLFQIWNWLVRPVDGDIRNILINRAKISWWTETRWFKVTFYPVTGGHQQPLKGSLHHPKTGSHRIARDVFFFVKAKQTSLRATIFFWDGLF